MKVIVIFFIVSLFSAVSTQAVTHRLSTLEINKFVAAKLSEAQTLPAVQVDIINSLLEDLPNRHFVSEFVVGRENVRSFLARSFGLLPSIHTTNYSTDNFLDHLSAPDGIEIALFFSDKFYGTGQKMPVIVFDAAFDGEGMVTMADLFVGLEYETNRIPVIMNGLKYRDFSLSREEYLEIDLQVKKSVLECMAMDNIFQKIFSGARRVSEKFNRELQLNFKKYIKILETVADGSYWYVNTQGLPVHVKALNEIRLAQAQLEQLQFTIEIVFCRGQEQEVIALK